MAHRERPHRWDPAWTKAPLVLIRYPGILAALAVGALLLSLTAAAYPLFLAGSSSRLLEHEIAAPLIGRYGAGITYRSRYLPIERSIAGHRVSIWGSRLYDGRRQAFSDLAAESTYLARPEETMLGPEVSVHDPQHPRRVRSARLAAGDHVLDHVDVIEGNEGNGVWIPDLIARGLQLGVGDAITLGSGDQPHETFTVDGVYRALVSQPPSGFWRPWDTEIYPTSAGVCRGDCLIPAQFILLDRAPLLELSSQSGLGQGHVSAAWQAPLRTGVGLTVDDAKAIRSFFHRAYAEATTEGTRTHRILGCCPASRYYQHQPEITFSSEIDHVVDLVRQQVTSLEGPGRVLQITGLLVAVTVLATAGLFSVSGRSTEFRLLSARGTGPGGAGAKAAVESVLPSVLGGAAGLGLAFLLAQAIASGAPLPATSITTAVEASLAAVGASIVALAVVSALGSTAHSGDRPGRFRAAARVPWEVPVLGFALVAATRLPSSLGSTEVALKVSPPSPYLLLFPIAFVGGFSGLGARLFREGARFLRRRGGIGGASSYLAVHRLAAGGLLSVLLVAAAGLCLGVFVQGEAVVRSLRTTVDAKARVFVGSDVRAWVGPDAEVPENFPLPVTKAARARLAGTVEPQGTWFDLLGVDPATLAGAAYWNEGFSDRSLAELARLLRPTGGVTPVVVAGASTFDPTSLDMSERTVPVRVVAHTAAFPGMLSRRPLVVVSAEAMARLYPGTSNPLWTGDATTELWVRGPPAVARDALMDPSIPVYTVTTAQQVKDLPRVATVIDTFRVLDVLGAASGVLVVVALLMYLQARQRSQIVAYGLSSRMGMGPGDHRRSLRLEIASMLMAALVLGVALGLVAAELLVGRLDPLPVVPPDPLFSAPVVGVAIALVALVAVSSMGAWLTTRRAASVHFGEAMRVAE